MVAVAVVRLWLWWQAALAGVAAVAAVAVVVVVAPVEVAEAACTKPTDQALCTRLSAPGSFLHEWV